MACSAMFCDTDVMVLTPAERQRRRRARLKAGEEVPCCTSCGTKLQLVRRERPDRQGDGLCWSCWIQTPGGRDYERERRKRARKAAPEKIRAQVLASVRRVRAKAKGGTTSTTDGGQP
jgi:ribosomal protein L34E